ALRAVPKLVFFQVRRALSTLVFPVVALSGTAAPGAHHVDLIPIRIGRILVHRADRGQRTAVFLVLDSEIAATRVTRGTEILLAAAHASSAATDASAHTVFGCRSLSGAASGALFLADQRASIAARRASAHTATGTT